MRKYLFLVSVLLFLFSSSVRADDTSLFTSPVPPNVLIILSSSNSMDEDFLGNAAGSYSPASKSVVGRNTLISMIKQFSNSINVGLMTYQNSGVSAAYIHNSPYFASYEPESYCPNLPPEPGCVYYAETLDPVAKTVCQTACQAGNPLFNVNYFDPIINPDNPVGSARSVNYAQLVYPKTQRLVNPTDPSNYIYYKRAYPFYDWSNDGNGFCYASTYVDTVTNSWEDCSYNCYSIKTGTSDALAISAGYSGINWFNGVEFEPTDSDYANGYDNFGQRMTWYYVGPAWFSNISPGGGYLQVPVGNLTDGLGNPTTTYNNLLSKLNPNENNPAGYMSCTNGDMNTCPYIINAGLTPTAGTFQTAINYYSGVNGYTSPIQAWCQKNFIVYITDGMPSADANGNPGNSTSLMPAVLANIATLRNITIGGTTFDIPTYVLGVGSDIQDITDLNQMAVQGGTDLNGQSYFASNPQQFLSALQAVFNDIMERSYSFTSPTVPTIRMVDNNILYMSAFTPNATPFWPGTLSAYQLNADGTLPVGPNGNPLNPPIWVDSIPASGRVIKTYTPEAGFVDFNSSNVTPADLGVATTQQANQIISYVSNQQLGDIFHSNAVIVGPPSQYFQDTGYSGPGGFYQTNQNRTKVIIVGANDGMLHAFATATGGEVWAFIPNSVLQNLIIMQAAHTYYVDGSPSVADVWFYSSPTETTQQKVESEWRTALVCGLRKGGNTFFALDITDTLNPTYLWQFPNPNDAATLSLVGQSWSTPAIGRVKIEGGDGNLYERWVAFVGGGYDPMDKVGNAFFVIDIKTGGIIWQFSYNSMDPQMQWMTYPLAAPPMAVDTNSDGYIDKVYIGDLGGQMWVFNVSFNALTNKSNSLWTGQRLFTAPIGPNEQHKIYYRAAVAFDTSGNPWVYFGTGDIENPTGSANPPERFYAVKDDGLGNYPRTETNLENVTNTNTFTPPQYPLEGWYILLQKSGNSLEKVLSSPSVFNHIVYFTTFTYTPSADLCSTTSASKLYAVDYLSGAGALTVYSLSQLLLGKPTQSSEQIGTGAPSSPVISVNIQGQATVIVGTTNSQIFSQSAFSPQSNKTILYWRDVTR